MNTEHNCKCIYLQSPITYSKNFVSCKKGVLGYADKKFCDKDCKHYKEEDEDEDAVYKLGHSKPPIIKDINASILGQTHYITNGKLVDNDRVVAITTCGNPLILSKIDIDNLIAQLEMIGNLMNY